MNTNIRRYNNFWISPMNKNTIFMRNMSKITSTLRLSTQFLLFLILIYIIVMKNGINFTPSFF